MTPQTNCYMALDYRQAGHKNQNIYANRKNVYDRFARWNQNQSKLHAHIYSIIVLHMYVGLCITKKSNLPDSVTLKIKFMYQIKIIFLHKSVTLLDKCYWFKIIKTFSVIPRRHWTSFFKEILSIQDPRHNDRYWILIKTWFYKIYSTNTILKSPVIIATII